jgi:hypothetical protein
MSDMARAAAAEAALTKALSLAPNHALAQYLLGAVHIFTNRAAEGIAKCDVLPIWASARASAIYC